MNILRAFFISLLLMFVTLSCHQKNTEEGIGYTEYIEAQELDSTIVNTYANGQERAVVYTVKGDPTEAIVKEVHYFEDGKVQVEGTLKNKQRHGVWTFYHDNGNVWSTGAFDNGKSVGCFHIYEPDGTLKIKSYYENNQKVKEDYYKEGKLFKSVDL